MTESSHTKLSDLTKRIQDVINQSFGAELHWIVAEISGHSFYPNSDRHYFRLIEKAEGIQEPIAKVDAVAWRAGSQAIAFFERETGQQFTNGLQVLAQVRIEFHPSHGFKLIVVDVDRAFTLGNLEKQRRETLLRLVELNGDSIIKSGEEYITKNKRLQVGKVIQHIAIIGSPKSEGYTDFTHTLESNQHQYKFSIDIYQSSVQGAEAGKELVNTLVAIYNSNIKYDCVVIIRGGGAKTDFVVFDTYDLARAVARFPIPVITGIGHHRDVSIVDLMAHTSTKTPTKAAEHIIFHNRSFEEELLQAQKNITIKVQQSLSTAVRKVNDINLVIINRSRTFVAHHKDLLNESNLVVVNKSRTLIAHHKDRLVEFNQTVINKTKNILYDRQRDLVSLLNQLLSRPRIITAHRHADLLNTASNLAAFSKKYLTNQRGFLGHFASVVNLMSPRNVLKKGFAIVSAKGKILNNAEAVEPGNDLTITMHEFDLLTKVITKTQSNGRKSDL